MDVAKYIGLFLLKNNFVYVHGLGNLEIKKKPSRHDGSTLSAPAYEVSMTSMGSIDDNLANYIATNEQVSISKASNALREFSMQARADMHKGQAVEIPGVGKFVEERGKTTFVTDANFTYAPPPIPVMKFERRNVEPAPIIAQPIQDIPTKTTQHSDTGFSRRESSGGSNISWMKIGLLLIAAMALGVIVYYGIQYMNRHNATRDMPLIITPDSVKSTSSTSDILGDTVATTEAPVESIDSSAAISSNDGLLSFDVLLNTYDNAEKAQRRTNKLKSYGNEVELRVSDDSTEFYVIMPLTNIAVEDTTHLLDSLRRNFNPSGVSIWR